MKEIIYFITLIVYAIFIIRFILSWIGGDFDLDDFDADLDLNDVVTFKGLTHFMMGACGWLSVKNFTAGNLDWYDWLIAFVVGILFTIILFYIYKFMLKLECKPKVLTGKGLIGQRAKIYLTCGQEDGNYKYVVTLCNGVGTQEYDAISTRFYSVGDIVTINNFDGAYYYVL